MTNKPLLFALFLSALAVAAWLGHSCKRHLHDNDVVKIPAEQARISDAQADSIRREAYAQKDAEYRPQIKALERDLAKSLTQYKPKQEKAQHSAATFVNSGKLEDCKTALSDCQEEAKAAAVVIAHSDSLINTQRAQRVNDSTEIVASHKTAQDFNTGWQAANLENAKMEKKIRNRNKLLKIGAGVIALLVGVVAVR